MSLVSQTDTSKLLSRLKADRPHPRYYPHTPQDHRHTHKDFRLVMSLMALCCTWQTKNSEMKLSRKIRPKDHSTAYIYSFKMAI